MERDLDGELTAEQDAFVRAHLADCAACRDRRAFQARLRAAVDAALAADVIPAGLAARLSEVLAREEAAG